MTWVVTCYPHLRRVPTCTGLPAPCQSTGTQDDRPRASPSSWIACPRAQDACQPGSTDSTADVRATLPHLVGRAGTGAHAARQARGLWSGPGALTDPRLVFTASGTPIDPRNSPAVRRLVRAGGRDRAAGAGAGRADRDVLAGHRQLLLVAAVQRWHPGDPWPYAFARTLPGYPTYSKDVPESRWIESS